MTPGSGLSHPDPDVDLFIKKLKIAFRKDYYGEITIPSNQKLAKILQMEETQGHATPFDFSVQKSWNKAPIQELLYALYKKGKIFNDRGSASFILNNLGELSLNDIYDRFNLMDPSLKEALIAVSELAIKKGYNGIYDPNPIQKLLMGARWFLSDHRNGEYVDTKELANFFGINQNTLRNYIYGTRAYVDNMDGIEVGIKRIKAFSSRSQQRFLTGLYRKAKNFVESWDNSLMKIVTQGAHDGFEDITNRRMDSVGVPDIHELELSTRRTPDNLIMRIQDGETESTSIFIRTIENKQSVIKKEKLIGHKWIAVDYTISPNEDWIKEKCEGRGYATKDRFLIIVLYGYHSDTTIKRAKTIAKRYDNVQLLTANEYKEFFGLSQDKKLLNEYDVLQQATIDAFNKEKKISGLALHTLKNIRRQALLNLRAHKEKYRKYFLGKQL